MPDSVDLLIEAKWIIPVEPAGIVLENHSVAIDKGRIVAILQQSEADALFFSYPDKKSGKSHPHSGPCQPTYPCSNDTATRACGQLAPQQMDAKRSLAGRNKAPFYTIRI